MDNQQQAHERGNSQWSKNLRLGKKNKAAGATGKNQHYMARRA